MSLDVSPELLERAEQGEAITDREFIDCVRTSLPYAWNLISSLVAEMEISGSEFADNRTPPPSEHDRGELLRAMASDAIKGAMERHFGVRLAFQNCHRAAVFAPTPDIEQRLAGFTTIRAQILNQSPQLRDC
ncbi:hypothetical protein BIV57_18920 [Mangrovactinospora gilvigrisea]|uniref:Uncharacterized protein n=1 Tax=Mangrovactinospora gilvigrisea TaxID=1428644 RepID=A0A1J7BR62_9ACTN|nr:SCO5389 family protein [Mangrovactinospora gilvigrisea]OIV35937.1 hypothetical protein BIV57_18920 [Mangrovactinospora gilvigrisea]